MLVYLDETQSPKRVLTADQLIGQPVQIGIQPTAKVADPLAIDPRRASRLANQTPSWLELRH